MFSEKIWRWNCFIKYLRMGYNKIEMMAGVGQK